MHFLVHTHSDGLSMLFSTPPGPMHQNSISWESETFPDSLEAAFSFSVTQFKCLNSAIYLLYFTLKCQELEFGIYLGLHDG